MRIAPRSTRVAIRVRGARISCAIARVRLRYALKDTMIMLVPMLLVLAAIIAWPEIPLLLPRLISPEFLR